jgi:hypothetical protein
MDRGSDVSRGRQFWESHKKKAFQLTQVSVKRSSDNRGSTVIGKALPTQQDKLKNIIKIKQDRQCTYNGTLRHVRVTTAAMEKQYVLHILSVCL